MPTYRLTVEYEGTRYRGWQEQANARTVAGELKRACAEVLGAEVELGGSGRTDAGVHALAQVAHLRCRAPQKALPPGALLAEVNERLPPDINLLAAEPAQPAFHARHDALSRSYLYQIARRRSAFAKRTVWWVRSPLDAERMRRAAAAIPGRHDFAPFCEKPAQQESTLVVVEGAEVVEAGDLLLVRLVASHFLWKMVRRLVGTLVEVGMGALPPELLAQRLAGEPAAAGFEAARFTAPPSGLFLERVRYPGEPPLSALAPATPLSTRPRAEGRGARPRAHPAPRRRR
ncbi:MAG TPA: tRNA pseudouridine(38-40) synthase TruA [Thermoanaerobaculia bacterium]|nr:tRNA pseudouridine(38-40) synthase TruA [Thermoanaerobaculia bacterium]